jgi:hypothetical protein
MDRIRPVSGTPQPQQAENQNAIAAQASTPAQPQEPRTRRGQQERSTGPSASLRLRRLMLRHQSIGDPAFDTKSPARKIAWLLRAVRESREGRHPYLSPIAVGARSLSKKEALCFALEIGAELQRDTVPAICAQLLANYEAEDISFLLFGIPFSRSRIADWARQDANNTANYAIEDFGRSLYQNYSRNLHSPAVMVGMSDQLAMISSRVPDELRCPQEQAEREIETYLQLTLTHGFAMEGYMRVRDQVVRLAVFDHSASSALTAIWNYIRAVPDEHLKSELKEALVVKLQEIGDESPSPVGTMERLIDTPTAIDWSITRKLSLEHLRRKLQIMATTVSEALDLEYADHVHALKNEADTSHMAEDIDNNLMSLKRERFLATADVDLGMVRGIDRGLVKAEAEAVFTDRITR